jgi:hypothetical protein
MKRVFWFLGRGLLAVALASFLGAGLAGAGGCGTNATGGSEAGNPSRTIAGSLALTSAAAVLTVDQASASTPTGCPADTIVAVDSRSQEQTSPVGADCSFSFDLFFNKAYSIRFRLNGVDVGGMVFQNSPDRFPSPVMQLSEQSDDVSLGLIVVNDGQSKPENEPAAQIDTDGDGILDIDDPDDDNDGILDVDEADCDLDGIIDDFDDDNSNCPLVKALPDNKILEVLPRNGSGIDTPESAVAIDAQIEARFSCEVDPQSISVDTFVVASQDAPDSYLQCDLSTADTNTSATCVTKGLVPDTAYKATIRSLRCTDGSSLAPTTWTWRTAPVSDGVADTLIPPTDPEKIPAP